MKEKEKKRKRKEKKRKGKEKKDKTKKARKENEKGEGRKEGRIISRVIRIIPRLSDPGGVTFPGKIPPSHSRKKATPRGGS